MRARRLTPLGMTEIQLNLNGGRMRINEFRARGVYGYLNLGILFSSNPAILIGPNGDGKTTALRLIQALLTPSLPDLLSIEFQEVMLRFDDQAGSERVILAKKTKANLSLSCSSVEGDLKIPISVLDAVEEEIPPHRRALEVGRALRVKYSDDAVFRAISEISLPVFLGLERTTSSDVDYLSDSRGEDFIYRTSASRRIEARNVHGSLNEGLAEIQGLVQRAYRRIRQLRDAQAERLRRKLLLTGFEYSTFSLGSSGSWTISEDSLSQDDLEAQREELLKALVSVGIDEAEARKELDPFFEKLIALGRRLAAKEASDAQQGEAIFESMMNRASAVRLKQLVGVVRDFNQKSAGLMSKFDAFLTCVNHFFADSRKSVEIDSVGLLKISRPGASDVKISALSSGERQLLIIFAHLFFNSFGDKSNVFIVDEPELSLHLRWQEVLLEKMVQSSPRAQIIVATHSPEIVGELTANCESVA